MNDSISKVCFLRVGKGGLFILGVAFLFLCLKQLEAQSGGQLAVDDIRDIMTKHPPTSIVPVILAVIGLIVAMIVGLIVLKRILTRQPEMGRVPPEFVARNRLQQICSGMDNQAPNKVSLEISEAVKDFLTAQYQDPIRFETAEEYLSRISRPTATGSIKFSVSLTEEVRSFMNMSQELKFAQIREAGTRVPALVNQAIRIIEMAVQDKLRVKH